MWHLLKPILFCSGNTGNLINDAEGENEEENIENINASCYCL